MDDEESVTRFLLTICHNFLQSKDYKRMTPDTETGLVSCKSERSDGHMTSDGSTMSSCLRETIYTPDCSNITPMSIQYQISNLQGLAEFLASGVDISLLIKRLQYVKGEEGPGELGMSQGGANGKQLKAQVSGGTKSGRNSVLSRQPSRALSKVGRQTCSHCGTSVCTVCDCTVIFALKV